MGGGIDAIADIGLGDIVGEAFDVNSIVTDFGSEFITPETLGAAGAAFGVPGVDVAGLGGYDLVGSFAGDATWFDAFNPGSILDNIPSVSDFSLPSLPSLPSISSVINAPRAINAAISGIGIPGVTGIVPNLNVNSVVAAGAAALGINPAVASTVTRTVSAATGLPNIGTAGFRELNAAETAQLIKNAPLINTLTDSGVPTAATAVESITGLPINTPRSVTENDIVGAGSQYTSVYDPENGTYSVFDNITGTTVQTGLTEQEAILAEQDLNVTGQGISLNTSTTATDDVVEQFEEQSRLEAAQRFANDPSPTEADVIALRDQARNQQTVRDLRQNKAASGDWRVRLRLAPNSTYLYNDPNPGILAPLASKTGTDGVIFPYTPAIETAYKANYSPYDLTHSNYRGYFYQSSYVDAINIRATFTAQDTEEANYLLAVIHFFRSATKMFYGKDPQRGSPPPLVYLSGYGDFQFNEHPCVIQQFNYTLPADVDYIRAYSALDASTSMLGNRIRQTSPGNPLSYAINRLLNNSLTKGALDVRPDLTSNFAVGQPTYVPTKIEISVALFPMQSRQQVSKQFSLQAFANGNQLKGGFW